MSRKILLGFVTSLSISIAEMSKPFDVNGVIRVSRELHRLVFEILDTEMSGVNKVSIRSLIIEQGFLNIFRGFIQIPEKCILRAFKKRGRFPMRIYKYIYTLIPKCIVYQNFLINIFRTAK